MNIAVVQDRLDYRKPFFHQDAETVKVVVKGRVRD